MSDPEHPDIGGEVIPSEPLKDYSAEVAPPPPPSQTDQIVERWFDEHIRGSIVGRDTQVWNHIMAAKNRLKDMLR